MHDLKSMDSIAASDSLAYKRRRNSERTESTFSYDSGSTKSTKPILSAVETTPTPTTESCYDSEDVARNSTNEAVSPRGRQRRRDAINITSNPGYQVKIIGSLFDL